MAKLTWRAPHTMPKNTDVICAFRWGKKDDLRVTVGRWQNGNPDNDQYPGVIESPDGCYLPCEGWIPLPKPSTHEPMLPLQLRTYPAGRAALKESA